MGQLRPPLITCESVLSEAAFLVRSLPEGGARVMELHAHSIVFTVDSGFRDVYRRNGRQVIPTLLPPRRGA